MKVWKLLPLMGMITSFLLSGGCTSGVKHLGKATLEDGAVVEYVLAKDKDFSGQDVTIIDAFYTDSMGTDHLGTARSDGPGLGKAFLPASVEAGGYIAGQALRRPDKNTYTFDNSSSSEGGNAEAEGGEGGDANQSQGQLQDQDQRQNQRQEQDQDQKQVQNQPKITPKPKPTPKAADPKELPPSPHANYPKKTKWKKKD